jgi:hypothetical protein
MFAFAAAKPVALYAQDSAPLGKGSVSVKLGYVVFSEGVVEDDGIYLGLEGYARVAGNLYLGAEVAAAYSMAILTDEMALVPLELNLKYARGVGSYFVLDGGVGLSYARAEFHDRILGAPSVTYHEWLFGGQIFGDFGYRVNWFYFGISAKYQLLQGFEAVEADFSNLRLGAQLGIVF